MKRSSNLLGSLWDTTRGKRVVAVAAEKVDGDDSGSKQLERSLADLPPSIITDILMRLPIKSVFICKFVCTSWKAVITADPHFAKLHFQHALFGSMIQIFARTQKSRVLHLLEYEAEMFENYDDDRFCGCGGFMFMKHACNSLLKLEHKFMLPLLHSATNGDGQIKKRGRPRRNISCGLKVDTVVNSCNGFLCLRDFSGDDYVVCNPVTGEFIGLPEPTRVDLTKKRPWQQELYHGFGFQPKTNEYKVVRILHRRSGPCGRESTVMAAVQMHTLGTSTWKNLGVDPRDFNRLNFPTCVNGALHWIGSYLAESTILRFDFESEMLEPFPSPPDLFKNDTANITMGELRGSLYICDSTWDSPVKVWIMKKYGVGESWSPVLTVDPKTRYLWPYDGRYWLVKEYNNGAAMLLYHSFNCFIYYQPENCVCRIFNLHGSSKIEVIPHIPSLISLRDAVKGHNIEVLNVDSRCAKFTLEEENEVLTMTKVTEMR